MTWEIPLLILVVVIMAVLFGFLFMQMDRAINQNIYLFSKQRCICSVFEQERSNGKICNMSDVSCRLGKNEKSERTEEP